jgi:hypothetical protein
VDKARLRENARIVRTMQGELEALYEVKRGRMVKEMIERIEAGEEERKPVEGDEQTNIYVAESALLGSLAVAFLELTEELAGDIDQDL